MLIDLLFNANSIGSLQILVCFLELLAELVDKYPIVSIEDGMAEIAEGVTLDSSPLIGKPVDYAHLPDGVTAAAIIREGAVIFPTPTTTIQSDDRLLLFYEASATRKVEQFFRVSADFF